MFSIDDFDVDFDEAPVEVSTKCTETRPLARDINDVFRKPSSSSPIQPIQHSLAKDDRVQIDRSPFRPFNKDALNSPLHRVRRKFPGPAGLLPDKPPRSFDDSSMALKLAEEDSDPIDPPMLCSQASETIFDEPPYRRLKSDLDMDRPDSPLNMYTVCWVKKKAASRCLKGSKIPFLAVVVQTVDCSSADPTVTLKDPTGEVSGALHRDVWKDLGDKLGPGAAIILKQVGVLSTGSRRQVILNITKRNITAIYTPVDGNVIINSVQPTTLEDILQIVSDWQAQASVVISSTESSTTPSAKLSLFEDVTSAKRLCRPGATASPAIRPPQAITPRQHNMASAHEKADKIINFSTPRNISKDNALFRSPCAIRPLLNSSSESNIVNANFDLFNMDNDFDIDEKPTNSGSVSTVNSSSCVAFSFKAKNSSDKNDGGDQSASKLSSQIPLSQAESIIVDQVLDGVDLDDFE